MHLFSPLVALIFALAPVFSPPNTGWVKLPHAPNHPTMTTWWLPSKRQRFVLSVAPFSGTTDGQRARFKAVFGSGSIPFRIESEGTLKICRGLKANRLTIVSTRGPASRSEHVYIAHLGKLYDLSYDYATPLPEAQAALATLCPATP